MKFAELHPGGLATTLLWLQGPMGIWQTDCRLVMCYYSLSHHPHLISQGQACKASIWLYRLPTSFLAL